MKIRRYRIRYTGSTSSIAYFTFKNYDPSVMIVEVLPFFQQNAIATVYRGFERFHNRFVISTNRGENFEEGDYIYVIFYINDSAYVSEVETVGDCVIEDLTGVILPCLNP